LAKDKREKRMVNWRQKQGKATEDEVRKSLEYLRSKLSKFWFHRMFDAKTYYQVNPALQAPKQPCDFICCFHGKFYGLEVKSSHSKRRYGLQYVKKHQKQSLMDIEKAGGEGWILLSWRRWNHQPRQRNRLFIFRIGDWLRMEKKVKEKGFKSAHWNTIIQYGIEVKRDKVWKLGKLFGVYI